MEIFSSNKQKEKVYNAFVVVGVIAMAVNGKLNKNHSNKLMRLRVLFQAIAIFVFVVIVWLARN